MSCSVGFEGTSWRWKSRVAEMFWNKPLGTLPVPSTVSSLSQLAHDYFERQLGSQRAWRIFEVLLYTPKLQNVQRACAISSSGTEHFRTVYHCNHTPKGLRHTLRRVLWYVFRHFTSLQKLTKRDYHCAQKVREVWWCPWLQPTVNLQFRNRTRGRSRVPGTQSGQFLTNLDTSIVRIKHSKHVRTPL